MEGLFGRDLELTAMEQFLNSTLNWPSAVVIEGEAGIGKTTLWLETVRRAEERGMRALRARPAESEQKLSYVALADLVVEAFDEVRPALPEVQQRALAAALVRDETVDGTSARTTATALVSVLAACAAKSTVLLAVDDIQWLDSASAESLAFALPTPSANTSSTQPSSSSAPSPATCSPAPSPPTPSPASNSGSKGYGSPSCC